MRRFAGTRSCYNDFVVHRIALFMYSGNTNSSVVLKIAKAQSVLCNEKYKEYKDLPNICICFDDTIDAGDLRIGDKPFNYLPFGRAKVAVYRTPIISRNNQSCLATNHAAAMSFDHATESKISDLICSQRSCCVSK